MPITVSKTDIRHACGERAYARGLDYARRNFVLDWTVSTDAHGVEIAARVRGTATYHQRIGVRQFGRHREIDGECSCPVGYNCKHVASVLIAWQATRPDAGHAGDRIQRWLDRVASLSDDRSESTDTDSPELLFILVPAQTDDRRVAVRLQSARRKRDGSGHGRPLDLAIHDRGSRRVAQASRPGDDDILRLLASLAGEVAPLLHGEVGAIAVRRMLATGRLFWQGIHGGPLSPGEPRQGRLDWAYADGSYRLTVETGSRTALPLFVDPPSYVDPGTREIGPLEMAPALDGRLLSALTDAPAIPARLAADVSEQLLRRLPHLDLPLPSDRPVEEITDLSPTPVLRVSAAPGDERPGVPGYRLELAFDYAGHRVWSPFQPLTQLAPGESILRVRRCAETEEAAEARIDAAGFVASTAGDGRRVFDAGHEGDRAAAIWSEFIDRELPRLAAAGWVIERLADFDLRFSEVGQIHIDAGAHHDDAGGWFDIAIAVDVDGQRVDLVPILASLAARIDDPGQLDSDTPLLVESSPGHWLKLPGTRIAPLLGALFDLLGRDRHRPDRLTAGRADAARLARIADVGVEWHGAPHLRDLAGRLAETPTTPEIPGLQAELRRYQAEGIGWLQHRRALGFGCLLADDMGLGKTLQTLSHLLLEKTAGRLDAPALVIVPTSLVGNWASEARRFTPSLRVLVLHGAARKALFDRIDDADLVLTTYPQLPRDEHALAARAYHSLVLDEAQNIKNPRAKAAQSARRLDARHRICLTGTPVENHLGELWALFNFLDPGYLGNARQFRQCFRVPIEQHGDVRRRQLLQDRVAPFLLRRTKQSVASELPDKVEIVRAVRLESAQAALYESVRATMDERVRDVLRHEGLDRGHVTVLDALLRLREVCCDPRLLGAPGTYGLQDSAKLALLAEMIPELVAEGRRILLFSQFTSMLGLIEQEVRHLGIAYTKLTGRTRSRDTVIARFRSGEVPLFLISLKAGGVGLNLTEADTVIHYDPWWNPAAENQATDRAHRIGQTDKVFVYKLVVEQSVEEKILALQRRKAALAAGVYRTSGDLASTILSEADIAALLRPLRE